MKVEEKKGHASFCAGQSVGAGPLLGAGPGIGSSVRVSCGVGMSATSAASGGARSVMVEGAKSTSKNPGALEPRHDISGRHCRMLCLFHKFRNVTYRDGFPRVVSHPCVYGHTHIYLVAAIDAMCVVEWLSSPHHFCRGLENLLSHILHILR